MSDNKYINRNPKSLMIGNSTYDLKNKPNERSMLNNSATMQWLAKRHDKTTYKKYLFLPEKLQKQQEIQQIFQQIDQDGSGI